MPAFCNVINHYRPPRPIDRLKVEADSGNLETARFEEKNPDLYRELLDRYSRLGDLVMDLFAGTFSSGVAAIQMGRRYYGSYFFIYLDMRVGVEVDPDVVAAAIPRLISKAQEMRDNHWTGEKPIGDLFDISALPVPSGFEILPPLVAQYKDLGDLDAAKKEAHHLGLQIRDSCIPSQLGVFTTEVIPKGIHWIFVLTFTLDTVIGNYWGTVRFCGSKKEQREFEKNDRLIQTSNFKRVDHGRRMPLYIEGSVRCAMTYINDPRGTVFDANIEFEELTAPELLAAPSLFGAVSPPDRA